MAGGVWIAIEISHTALKGLSSLEEGRSRNAIRTFFIFLDLLKSHTKRGSKLRLRKSESNSTFAYRFADLAIDWRNGDSTHNSDIRPFFLL